MKTIFLGLTGATLVLTALPGVAQAQPWQNINARQDRLYSRIEQGVRSGRLDRREAANLRTRFVQLERLEGRYRRDGLNRWERGDLNRRYDALSAAVRVNKRDWQRRG